MNHKTDHSERLKPHRRADSVCGGAYRTRAYAREVQEREYFWRCAKEFTWTAIQAVLYGVFFWLLAVLMFV